jgi:hypothetical protein
MATAEFHERKSLFDAAVQSGMQVLSHPDLKTPNHPYVDHFVDRLENSTLGVIDVTNGIIHATDSMKHDGIAIVPMTYADTKNIKPDTKITFADDFLKEEGTSPVYDFSYMRMQAAECRIDPGLVNPVIILHPNLGYRTRLQLGSTVVHEMDHAHWDRNPIAVWPNGDMDTVAGDVSMEVSAYGLEGLVFAANASRMYADVVRSVRAKFKGFDFTSQNVTFTNGANHLLRNMRSVAFINMMFNICNAKPGGYPSDELIAAMRAQNLVNIDKILLEASPAEQLATQVP